MQRGNGVDLAAVYQLLREVAEALQMHTERFGSIDRRLDEQAEKLNQIIQVMNEHGRRFEEAAAVFNRHEGKLDDVNLRLDDLRGTLDGYHRSVLGQGVLLSDAIERVERIEKHLGLAPLAK